MINDIASELAKLHDLQGADFVKQLERIAARKDFKLLDGETSIYAMGDYQHDDFAAIIYAAHKAVDFGYKVFILPNPKGIRTADFIFEQKGILKMYDLKTIQGKASVLNRLLESVGQTHHVLLNITTNYNARQLAKEILAYFQINPLGFEVLIFKHKKLLSVTRKSIENKDFVKVFMRTYLK